MKSSTIDHIETLTRIKKSDKNQVIHGIAHTAAIDGDDNIFYQDNHLRLTVSELKNVDMRGQDNPFQLTASELKNVDMRGVLIYTDHTPAIGRVIHSWVDDEGNLHIIGDVANNVVVVPENLSTNLGKLAIN